MNAPTYCRTDGKRIGGPMQTRIEIWLHKPTNTLYVKVVSNGAAILMKGTLKDRWATEAELNDARIWSKV